MKFSAINRKEYLNKISSEELDLLIIGGGITGAGIALDAAVRGMKVGLIEKNDFAYGTSSRSTKLVHGGLRYLKQLQFKIVREVGHERKIVHENAAHIVLPEKLVLPIYKNGTYGKLAANLALWMYDYLAGVKKSERRVVLNKEKTLLKEPLLSDKGLKGGIVYYEYKTNDSRLTIEVIKKAVEYGAIPLNYIEAQSFTKANSKVNGVIATDNITGDKIKIKAKSIVNSTGPWVDDMRLVDDKNSKKQLLLSKGVHIVFSRKRFPLNHSVYFDVSDGRMIFAIPRFNSVYVGTTDTIYEKDKNNPRLTNEDIDYLIEAINSMFPKVEISSKDIISSWAGLRPLIFKKGKSPSELSRKDEVFISDSGLISIAGGKLTGYRLMAKKIADYVSNQLLNKYGKKFDECSTEKIQLSGGEFDFEIETHNIIEYADVKFDEVKDTGISSEDFKTLFYRYGKNIDIIAEKAYELRAKNEDNIWLKAETWYLVNYEMAINLSDIFIRRTGMLHFEAEKITPELIDITANEMQRIFNWSDDVKETHKSEFIAELEQAVNLT